MAEADFLKRTDKVLDALSEYYQIQDEKAFTASHLMDLTRIRLQPYRVPAGTTVEQQAEQWMQDCPKEAGHDRHVFLRTKLYQTAAYLVASLRDDDEVDIRAWHFLSRWATIQNATYSTDGYTCRQLLEDVFELAWAVQPHHDNLRLLMPEEHIRSHFAPPSFPHDFVTDVPDHVPVLLLRRCGTVHPTLALRLLFAGYCPIVVPWPDEHDAGHYVHSTPCLWLRHDLNHLQHVAPMLLDAQNTWLRTCKDVHLQTARAFKTEKEHTALWFVVLWELSYVLPATFGAHEPDALLRAFVQTLPRAVNLVGFLTRYLFGDMVLTPTFSRKVVNTGCKMETDTTWLLRFETEPRPQHQQHDVVQFRVHMRFHKHDRLRMSVRVSDVHCSDPLSVKERQTDDNRPGLSLIGATFVQYGGLLQLLQWTGHLPPSLEPWLTTKTPIEFIQTCQDVIDRYLDVSLASLASLASISDALPSSSG